MPRRRENAKLPLLPHWVPQDARQPVNATQMINRSPEMIDRRNEGLDFVFQAVDSRRRACPTACQR